MAIHIMMFVLNLLGFTLLAPTMQKQRKQFAAQFSWLGSDTVRRVLKMSAFSLFVAALVLSVFTQHEWFFVVAWFGWLSASAGIMFFTLKLLPFTK